MKTLRLAAILCAVVGLGACASQSQKAAVAASESALTAAGSAILAYTSLPQCPQSTPICYSAEVKQQAKTAFDKAYDVVTKAQTAVDAGQSFDSVAVSTAMTSLQAIVATFPKKQQ